MIQLGSYAPLSELCCNPDYQMLVCVCVCVCGKDLVTATGIVVIVALTLDTPMNFSLNQEFRLSRLLMLSSLLALKLK